MTTVPDEGIAFLTKNPSMYLDCFKKVTVNLLELVFVDDVHMYMASVSTCNVNIPHTKHISIKWQYFVNAICNVAILQYCNNAIYPHVIVERLELQDSHKAEQPYSSLIYSLISYIYRWLNIQLKITYHVRKIGHTNQQHAASKM